MSTGGTPAGGVQDERRRRLVAAASACVARWGVAKTTLDDVAREAGVSRASAYRAFPGGKDAVLAELARTELDRFFALLGDAAARAEGAEDVVTALVTTAARALQAHPVVRTLVAHEPGIVASHLGFHRFDAALAEVRRRLEPHLAPAVGSHAAEVAEWAARIVLSYALHPTARMDLADEAAARRLVGTFLLPGLTPAARRPTRPATTTPRGTQP
jgi:AcrR family transcriptional regulator